MVMKNTFLLIALFLRLSACSQTPEKEGLLWKISGKDLEQPSYLFGTYHGTHGIGAEFLDSISGFYNAFNSVTQFIGESDFSTNPELANGYFAKYYGIQFMPANTTYKDLLSENDYQYLDSIARVWGRTFLDKIPVRPNYLWFLIIQTKMNEFMKQVFNDSEKENMDIHLQKIAREKGYMVKGLDSPDILFKSLESLYGNTPMPLSLQESADTLINNVKRIDEMYETEHVNSEFVRNIRDFENAYKRQDLSGLEKYKKEQVDMVNENNSLSNVITGQSMSFLLEERNFYWMEKIPELITNQPTMIGVGACHLYGKDGLINLLRHKGYKLEVVK